MTIDELNKLLEIKRDEARNTYGNVFFYHPTSEDGPYFSDISIDCTDDQLLHKYSNIAELISHYRPLSSLNELSSPTLFDTCPNLITDTYISFNELAFSDECWANSYQTMKVSPNKVKEYRKHIYLSSDSVYSVRRTKLDVDDFATRSQKVLQKLSSSNHLPIHERLDENAAIYPQRYIIDFCKSKKKIKIYEQPHSSYSTRCIRLDFDFHSSHNFNEKLSLSKKLMSTLFPASLTLLTNRSVHAIWTFDKPLTIEQSELVEAYLKSYFSNIGLYPDKRFFSTNNFHRIVFSRHVDFKHDLTSIVIPCQWNPQLINTDYFINSIEQFCKQNSLKFMNFINASRLPFICMDDNEEYGAYKLYLSVKGKFSLDLNLNSKLDKFVLHLINRWSESNILSFSNNNPLLKIKDLIQQEIDDQSSPINQSQLYQILASNHFTFNDLLNYILSIYNNYLQVVDNVRQRIQDLLYDSARRRHLAFKSVLSIIPLGSRFSSLSLPLEAVLSTIAKYFPLIRWFDIDHIARHIVLNYNFSTLPNFKNLIDICLKDGILSEYTHNDLPYSYDQLQHKVHNSLIGCSLYSDHVKTIDFCYDNEDRNKFYCLYTPFDQLYMEMYNAQYYGWDSFYDQNRLYDSYILYKGRIISPSEESQREYIEDGQQDFLRKLKDDPNYQIPLNKAIDYHIDTRSFKRNIYVTESDLHSSYYKTDEYIQSVKIYTHINSHIHFKTLVNTAKDDLSIRPAFINIEVFLLFYRPLQQILKFQPCYQCQHPFQPRFPRSLQSYLQREKNIRLYYLLHFHLLLYKHPFFKTSWIILTILAIFVLFAIFLQIIKELL